MDADITRLTIGPATGWLYAKGIYSLALHEKVLKDVEANCVEINLSSGDDNDKRLATLKSQDGFSVSGLKYCSLHLPPHLPNQADNTSAIKDVVSRWNMAAAVIHPVKIGGSYPVGYYERMVFCGVPLAIENMDSSSPDGFKITDLESLVRTVSHRFVFDVQHAYEHDHGMFYATDLFDSLADTLIYIHVSGETADNIHALLCEAVNTDAIIEFLGKLLARKNVPLIIEGKCDTIEQLQREIDFIKRQLDFY